MTKDFGTTWAYLDPDSNPDPDPLTNLNSNATPPPKHCRLDLLDLRKVVCMNARFLQFRLLWHVAELLLRGRTVLPATSQISVTSNLIHCKKKVSGFPAPSRDVTYQTLPGLELLN